jgi:autotransporter-associated beta strand protein
MNSSFRSRRDASGGAAMGAAPRCCLAMLCPALCAIALMSDCNVSKAQSSDNWITAGGGSWSLGANWSAGSVPTANEVATIGSIATSVASPASITLDTDQTAFALTLSPGSNKSIHLDPGANSNSRLTLLHAANSGPDNYLTINVVNGTGNQVNASIVLGTGANGSFTATINSADTAFAINGGLLESAGTWGVKISGQGIVSYATTPSNYSGDSTITNGGILRLDVNNAIPNGISKGNVVLEGGGSLQFLNATAQTINGLNSTSSVATVSNLIANNGTTLTVGNANASGTFAGQIGNTEAKGIFNLVKIGSGTQRLNGANSYHGTTTVLGGTLLVNGKHTTAGSYSVSPGATLGGTGTIELSGSSSSVTVSNGSLAPGDNGPGVLNIKGTLNLSTVGTLRVELGGPSPGNNEKSYDQVNMTASTASINASFAHVAVNLVNGFTPKSTDIFYILTRADSAAFGAPQPFDAYPEGAKINLGNGWTGKVTYLANWQGIQTTSTLTGGNDMAIFNVTSVPEPASLVMLVMAAAIAYLPRRRTAW